MWRDNQLKIPDSVNFYDIGGLSAESKELLERYQPDTIGQVKIPGLTPAALWRYCAISKPASARMTAGRPRTLDASCDISEERLLLNSFLDMMFHVKQTKNWHIMPRC